MSKLPANRVFAMQGAKVPEPPQGLPLGSGRAIDALTSSDAAAICGGLGRRYFLAGRVQWMQDWSSCAELESYLWVEVAGLAHKENWTLAHGQETMRSLAGLAIAEMADPARYGSEAARVAWWGRRLKLDGPKIWQAWEKTWRSRYQAVYQILERWSDVSASHVAYRQREEEENSP